MNVDGSDKRVLTGGLDRSVGNPDLGGRRPLDLRPATTSTAATGRPRRPRRLGPRRRDRADRRAASTGPMPAASSASSRDGAVAVTAGDHARTRPTSAIATGGQRAPADPAQRAACRPRSWPSRRSSPVTSSYDKRPIDAWMVTPPDFDPAQALSADPRDPRRPVRRLRPALLDRRPALRGGRLCRALHQPARLDRPTAQEFADQIDKAYPGHDYDDLMSAVDAAIATGHVDPDNLFVTGGSGGGVLTAWIVGKTDRFRAAATQKPVINWTSFALTTDFAAGFFARTGRKERRGRTRRAIGHARRSAWSATSRRRPWSSSAARITAPRSARPSNIIRRSSCAASRRRWSRCPGASHGGIAARPSQAAAKASGDPRLVRPLPHATDRADGRRAPRASATPRN